MDDHSKIDKLLENQYPTHFSISINRPFEKTFAKGYKGDRAERGCVSYVGCRVSQNRLHYI